MLIPVLVVAALAIQPEGARRHQVHLATSDDGLVFTAAPAPIAVQAGWGEILELSGAGSAGEKGALAVYMVDGRAFAHAGGLARLLSTDGGKTWRGPEPVTIEGRGEAPAGVAAVQLPDGRIRLYYVDNADTPGIPSAPLPRTPDVPVRPRLPPVPRDPSTPTPPTPIVPGLPAPGMPTPEPSPPGAPMPDPGRRILSAVSGDGVRFAPEDGVRVQGAGLAEPEVVFSTLAGEGGQWLLFAREGDGVTLARSSDGLTFERDGVFRLGGGGAAPVVLMDGRVRVYQAGAEGVTSVVFNPRSQALEPESGVRIGGSWTRAAAWRRAGGGYVMVLDRARTGLP